MALLKRNPASGVDISPMGRELPWLDSFTNEVRIANRTALNSHSRRKVALQFIQSALKSAGTIVPPSYDMSISNGSGNGLSAIGVNTWIIPYLENAVVLLSGEGELDW